MDLYLVRHGETEIGDDHLYPSNASLTELGQRQADAACDALESAGITHIFTSGLQRAKESAARAVQYSGLTPVALPGLDEVRIGDLRDAPIETIKRRLYNGPPVADFSEFDGESTPEFEERIIYSFTRDVVEVLDESSRPALFVHGGTISVLLDYAEGKRFEPMMLREVPNSSITLVNVTEFKLVISRPPSSDHLATIGVTQMSRPDRNED
ncbi:MAG: histidine phosphatase family protein [Chloroflexi bacterium]|nr:histidine phosphatase family protein [Chloroflexota bacterium]